MTPPFKESHNNWISFRGSLHCPLSGFGGFWKRNRPKAVCGGERLCARFNDLMTGCPPSVDTSEELCQPPQSLLDLLYPTCYLLDKGYVHILLHILLG